MSQAQVLYRKYRPKTFAEVEGQEHVVRTLQGALLSGRVGHAYLFCGPRGTGKTTMARLLAKAINCLSNRQLPAASNQLLASNNQPEARGQRLVATSVEPCNACPSCNEINESRSLDIIEIDAASNRGIDEIRNLKDSAQVAATSGGYKIFIIDEVHMLTPPAFNALLKVLEEPPVHVVFVLATTEPHKVPDTVLSRVQRFDFKKISLEHIQKKLREISKQEKLRIDDDALATIASASSGSLRDAESALNKLIAYAGISVTDKQVVEALGIVPHYVHQKLLELIQQKKSQEAIAQVAYLYESGVDMNNFTKQFVKYLRSELINLINKPAIALSDQIYPHTKPVQAAEPQISYSADHGVGTSPEFLIKAINLFVKAGSELRFSSIPQLPVELAILEAIK